MKDKHLTLSEAGLALVLLDNEVRNNMKELYRWQNRRNEAEVMMDEARERLDKNMRLLQAAKANINR